MEIEIELNLEKKQWKNSFFFENEILKNFEISKNLTKKKLFDFVNFVTNLTLENIISQKDQNIKIVISFLFSDNQRLKQLNTDFRKKDCPTNILSFESLKKEEQKKLIFDHDFSFEKNCENEIFLGDIAVSFEKVFEESIEGKIHFIDHLTHLLVHGVLHLLGFDHETCQKDAEEMEQKEIEILKKIGISNPYN